MVFGFSIDSDLYNLANFSSISINLKDVVPGVESCVVPHFKDGAGFRLPLARRRVLCDKGECSVINKSLFG